MITADARTYVARNRMIDQLATYHKRQTQFMWDLLDNDFDTGVLDELQHSTAEAEWIIDQLPDAEDLEAWWDLHRRLGHISPGLGHEDREYLALVRCDLHDAIDAVARASFDEAVTHIDKAHRRLHWLAHGRKREGARPMRWAGTHQRGRFAELANELAAIAKAIRRARRVAS
jgi:hypothetical protein